LRNRVFTYITRADEILLFDHVDHRHLAPQIPGGTIEVDENPASAAIREAMEETGLKTLSLSSFLGDEVLDFVSSEKEETLHAWFYHIVTAETTPTRWRHFEEHASGNQSPIEFELYWVPIADVPELGGLDGVMLGKVQELF